jgi:hypothetical protein
MPAIERGDALVPVAAGLAAVEPLPRAGLQQPGLFSP